jgi:hypothetical protein
MVAARSARSGHHSEPGGLSPLPEAHGAELTVRLGGEEVATGTKVVANGAEDLEAPLGVLR